MNSEPPAAPPPPARNPRRLNADYRWTVPKVTAFLEALARSGQVAEAARSVGMGRQSAYKLRARLAGTRLAAAFEGARKQGIRARAEASRERLRSRWDGPLIGAYFGRVQGDSARPQGDSGMAQGDTRTRQGDTRSRQGDRFAPKATKDRQDTVTSVTGAPAGGCAPRPLRARLQASGAARGVHPAAASHARR
jgi:hypothetical protein